MTTWRKVPVCKTHLESDYAIMLANIPICEGDSVIECVFCWRAALYEALTWVHPESVERIREVGG